MVRKYLKYLVIILVVGLVLKNTVYIRKLSEVHAATLKKRFDAEGYAHTFWNKKLIPSLNKAVEIDTLIAMLKAQPENTFNAYSHALGIGNLKYFLVKGEGKILAVGENSVTVLVKGATTKNVIEIATEYVYGNAIRDASGIINMTEFDNTMDFNEVSAGINKIVRTKVLPDFIARVKEGTAVQFAGAIELNKKHLSLKEIEVVPIALKIIN
ncbi:DUF2291 domain-containing protein [Pedobacter immunditicola]|uniref:DUF2291 domain-containing protein n=1 Tax=Pedobacter immunditicola TaxID=3133440 RepID=UPI0030B084F3